MSTYQCPDLFYVIDVIKSFLQEKHFFNFLWRSIYKKRRNTFLIIKICANNKQERNLPQMKIELKWKNDYQWLDFSNDGTKC